MRSVALDDLLTSARSGYWGSGPDESETNVQVIRNGDVKPGSGIRWEQAPTRSLRRSEVEKSRIFRGDILLTTSGDCGVVAYVGETPEVITCASNFIRVLRFDESVADRRYAFHYLQTTQFRDSLRPYIRGTTLQNLSTRQAFPVVSVPLPPLEEQRRIAAILDQADANCDKRRQSLAHLDSLTQSIFHDMFGSTGDPRWDRLPLGEVVDEIGNGKSPNCESREARADEVGILKLGAVTYGVFQAHENKAYLGHIGAMATNEVRAGDVLMTRKNTRELVGAVALVEEVRPGLLLPDLIFRLKLDEKRVDRRYFQALMMNPEKRPSVRALSSGSAASMPNISKARLRLLALEIPPLDLQQKFSTRLEWISAQRAAMQSALETEHALIESLQSKAFQGAL